MMGSSLIIISLSEQLLLLSLRNAFAWVHASMSQSYTHCYCPEADTRRVSPLIFRNVHTPSREAINYVDTDMAVWFERTLIYGLVFTYHQRPKLARLKKSELRLLS